MPRAAGADARGLRMHVMSVIGHDSKAAYTQKESSP
jgi:hypothetical protein